MITPETTPITTPTTVITTIGAALLQSHLFSESVFPLSPIYVYSLNTIVIKICYLHSQYVTNCKLSMLMSLAIYWTFYTSTIFFEMYVYNGIASTIFLLLRILLLR